VEVTRGNVTLAEYLQRCIGYSLTGDVDEHVFFILYGSGANGKSTFVDTIKKLLGSYAGVVDRKTLIATPSSGVPNDVIKLQGLRFGAAAEIEVNSKLNESMLKDLTGGDDVTGRKLFKEYEDFAPQIKIWVSANYLPQIRGTDEGIWRRVRLIPFEVRFEGKQRDKRLKEKFRESELPGILAWAVRGATSWWRTKDLATPEVVKKATQSYRIEEDQVHQFIEEECRVDGSLFEDHHHRILKMFLYKAYQDWARENGYKFPLTHPAFTKQLLTVPGIYERRTHGQNYWYGLRFKIPGEKEF
jgi:putative DNA primase/helicase